MILLSKEEQRDTDTERQKTRETKRRRRKVQDACQGPTRHARRKTRCTTERHGARDARGACAREGEGERPSPVTLFLLILSLIGLSLCLALDTQQHHSRHTRPTPDDFRLPSNSEKNIVRFPLTGFAANCPCSCSCSCSCAPEVICAALLLPPKKKPTRPWSSRASTRASSPRIFCARPS